MVTSEEQGKITTVENKLKMYARLEAQIAYVGHYPTPDAQKELFHQLAEIRLHMGESAQLMIREYYRTTDIDMIKTLIPLITVEMNKLHKKKDKLVPEEAFGGVFQPVMNLFKPFKPIVILTVWILLSVVIGIGVMLNTDPLTKWNIALLFLSILFSFSIGAAVVSLYLEKSLRKLTTLNWIATLSLLCAPLLGIVLFQYSYAILPIQIIALIVYAKMNKPTNIITFK
ncbi:hypothetical protein ACE3MZ_03545 [Paenibacillus sp. WLX1005]|uniref:hypothetical protein n=1 Tax=Paenibacillus sp. WLX1005 TaxID=3243766 RepID=UPI003983E3F0